MSWKLPSYLSTPVPWPLLLVSQAALVKGLHLRREAPMLGATVPMNGLAKLSCPRVEAKTPAPGRGVYAASTPAGTETSGIAKALAMLGVKRHQGRAPKIACLLIPAALLLCSTAPRAGAESLLLSGASIHTISGETLSPGQVLIQDGKIAAVGKTLPADGSLLDIRAHVKHLWIAGNEVSLENRHSRLYEKYKHRPLPQK